MKQKTINLISTLLVSLGVVVQANATVVEFRTNIGDIQVNLYDEITPQTVSNFLEYVNAGAYANSVIHRSVDDFVVQGGGYVYNNELPLDAIAAGVAVENEPALSNVSGTISMAKLANDPNSATSQWFFNVADNSANLDVQNGGFSVFGQVIGDGMSVLSAIQELPRYDMGGAANSIPLRNYSNDDASNEVEPTDEHLVIIQDIVVIDDASVTNPDLTPVENTLIDQVNVPDSGNDNVDNGGGGSMGLGYLALLLLLVNRKRFVVSS
ncbi:MAG: peptidylprolyl isomerase [Aestuariibacter sp.]